MTLLSQKVSSVGSHSDHVSTFYEVVPNVMAPITEDGDLVLDCGAYLIQNVGNSPVCLNDNWTIMPSGNLGLGANQINVVVKKKFRVKFKEACVENKCYPGNRLEIMELCATICCAKVQ